MPQRLKPVFLAGGYAGLRPR